jgi:class 3 adenylate cyclase
MAPAPTGTVTFLFTDIEGSTRLWERNPEAMQAALIRHDALLREAIDAHGGYTFKTVGDAFCAAFASPLDAIRAAVDGQRALAREVPQIRVRMAIHSGAAELRGGDYFGPALNRVARLLAAGHGGQTLLSSATAEQVREDLPADVGLRLLGRHQLRDIVEWETIFDLKPPDLPAKFPPLNTMDVAFRRGMVRAAIAMGVVLAVVASLALLAWNNAVREAEQRRRASLALTRQVAERLDGDLRGLAMVGNVLAATLARDGGRSESRLSRAMTGTLSQEPRIFGMALAFEPGRFDPAREDYCLYVFRGPAGIEKKYLHPPTYQPIYREWAWYRQPRETRQPSWSEPYVDKGGGEIPMVTYSAPLAGYHDFAGVQTVDLSVEYFDALRGWLEEIHLGENSYAFILSAKGTFISHPHPEYDFAQLAAAGKGPRSLGDLEGVSPSFVALARAMRGRSGSGSAIDPVTGRPATFLFAPVPSAGWSFVTVVDAAAQVHAPERGPA